MPEDGVVLMAQWSKNQYTITYNLATPANATVNPNSINSVTEDALTQVTLAAAPTVNNPVTYGSEQKNYTFVNWKDTSDGDKTYNAGAQITLTKDMTLVAVWSDKAVYTITFDQGSVTSSTVQGLPSSLTVISGQTSQAWTNPTAGGGVVDADAGTITSYAPTDNVTLTAQWTLIQYNITWNLDSGTLANKKDTYTIEDSTYTLPIPTKNNHAFLGWYTENTFANKVTEIAQGSTGAKQFYAKWMELAMVTVAGGGNNAEWSGVTVSTFKMGKYEVTQAQWKAVMGSLPNTSSMAPADGDADNNPVNYVSWFDAIVFCNELSKMEGKEACYYYGTDTNKTDYKQWGGGAIPDSNSHSDYKNWNDNIKCNWNANGYRLPTEAEWEYAARGGSGNPHPKYSGLAGASLTEDELKTVAWYNGNEGSKTHEVGTTQVKENALGISDMSGNVSEWCWDWNSSSGYESANTQQDGSVKTSDPLGAASGSYRVIRDGSWRNNAAWCAVSLRNENFPYTRNFNYGFRVVCRQ